MARAKLIIALVLAALFVVVMVQNTDVVTLRFLVWEMNMSRIVLLLLSLATGFVLGYIIAKATGKRA